MKKSLKSVVIAASLIAAGSLFVGAADAKTTSTGLSITVFYASSNHYGKTAVGGNVSYATVDGNTGSADAGGGGKAKASYHSVSVSGGGHASASGAN